MQHEFVLEMKHITKTYGNNTVLSDVSLSVKPGEIHALLGENGAGKSTLMSVLFGLYQPEEGEIRMDGKKVEINSVIDAVKHKIALVPEDRKRHGVIGIMSVLDNITVSNIITRGQQCIVVGGYLKDSVITNVVNCNPDCPVITVDRENGLDNVLTSNLLTVGKS